MKWVWILLFLSFCCCEPMTNQEIIDEVAFCKKKDMDAKYIHWRGDKDRGVEGVLCVPKKEECRCDCNSKLKEEINDYEE